MVIILVELKNMGTWMQTGFNLMEEASENTTLIGDD